MSAYIKALQSAFNSGTEEGERFGMQLMADLVTLALNQEFGFGPERLMRFCKAISKKYGDFADLWNGDTKDVEYSKAVLDRALKQICGKYFIPWDERYTM